MPTDRDLSGVRKAALLMLALGEPASTELMKRLQPDEVERIALEIARMGSVETNAAGTVLREFVTQSEGQLRGGRELARKLVERSLGSDHSRRFQEKLADAPKKQHRLTGFGSIDPEHLANFVQNEHPQTIALVIAHLESSQAASVFRLLPDELRAQVSLRMAALEETSPEVLERIAGVLEKRLRGFGEFRRETYGGVRAVAELLNRLDRNVSRDVLDTLENADPEVALSVRNLMFVFDDILLLDDKAIREVLQQVDKKTLAVALKGTTAELQDHFFRNMSQRAGENLREEMDLMGPVKLKDVEESQKEIVEAVKKLEEQGKLSIGTGADEYVI